MPLNKQKTRCATRAGGIRNPEHYFNRYIAKEVLNDQKTQEEYDSFFCFLDERLEGGRAWIGKGLRMVLAVDDDGEDLERALSDGSLLAWIDLIDNQTLYKAIKRLPHEQQRDSVVLSEQLRTIDKARLYDRMGALNKNMMK